MKMPLKSCDLSILRRFAGLRPYILRLIALLIASLSAPAIACQVTTPTSVSVGTYSPSAVKAGNAPLTKTSGGFSCESANVLTVLSGNFLKATVKSDAALVLTSATTTDTISYRLFADAGATTELKPGVAAYYMNGTVVNLLNLLGSGAIDVPVYFRLASTGFVKPGTYKGSFSVKWDWYFCNGIGVLGGCLGIPDADSKSVTVNVTLTVEPKPPLITVAIGSTSWNSLEGTLRPKAIPGSKRRVTLTITNPDVVATEVSTMAIVLPTPSFMAVALDGDGTGSGAVVQTSEGSPKSTLTMTYGTPGSTADNVDFSSNGGTDWSYAPVAGNAATQSAVTHIRFRPQGSMAAQSSYSISIPYSVM